MEKVMRIFFGLLCLLPGWVISQEAGEQYIHKHLLRATMTFGYGAMKVNSRLNGDNLPAGTGVQVNYYLTGNAEYYADNRISVRGDGYYFLPGSSNSFVKEHHQFFGGFLYHFKTKNHWDPFMGLQTGWSFTRTMNADLVLSRPGSMAVNPLFSCLTGVNYYASKWFNLFFNLRVTQNQHASVAGKFNSGFLELNGSFGLGFHLF